MPLFCRQNGTLRWDKDFEGRNHHMDDFDQKDVPMSFLDLFLRSERLREQAREALQEGDKQRAIRLIQKSRILEDTLLEVLSL